MAKAQGKNAAVDAIDDGMRENMIAVNRVTKVVKVRVRAAKYRLPYKRLWIALVTAWFVFRSTTVRSTTLLKATTALPV